MRYFISPKVKILAGYDFFILWEIVQNRPRRLYYLDTSKTWIGEQPSAAIRRFFILWEIAQNRLRRL